jgi:hypothetical protein
MPGIGDGNGSRPQRLAHLLHRFRVDRLDDPAWLEDLQEAAVIFLSRIVLQQKFLRHTARPTVIPNGGPVEWLDAKQVGELYHRSESWVRHMPADAIPGRRQHVKGGKVLWNKQILLNHLAACSSQ